MSDRSKSAPRPSYMALVEEAKKSSNLVPPDIFYLFRKQQPFMLNKPKSKLMVLQRPPERHTHQDKEYKNTSPLRSKLMIQEAKLGLRKIMKRKSLNESEFILPKSSASSSLKRGTISTAVSRGNLSPKEINQSFIESVTKNISALINQQAENSSLLKRCQDKYNRQIKHMTSNENSEFFTAQDKSDACKDYVMVQKRINLISKGRVNRGNHRAALAPSNR